jgi:phage-related tail fiber protein
MKRILFIIVCFLIINNIIAQIPKNFKYQAVVRDATGQIMVNKVIALRLSIIEDQENGTVVYSETYNQFTTNDYGYFNVNVGSGGIASGNFNNIHWGEHIFYLKVELDINGGSNYVIMGTSQILAVPYALWAQDVVNNNDADADPTNEIQDLRLENNVLTITNNPNATPISLAQYIGVNTDNQTLSIQPLGNTVQLSITGGNTVAITLPSDFVSKASGGTFLGPINATNIQGSGILSLQGNLTLSGNNPVQFNTSGITTLNLPVSGTLATQDWVSQNIASSNTLATGNIWVGVANVATPLIANGIGQILIGNGSGIGSYPISGDASLNSTGTLTLSNTGVPSGYYFKTQVDTKGRVIGGSNPTTLAGFGISDAITSNLSSGNIYVGNSSNIASQVTMSGDASLSNSGVLSLAPTPVVPGTYFSVTVDAKGRVTYGNNPSTLAGFGIMDGLSRNLNNANLYVGNGSNIASQVVIQGDASLANNGYLTLSNSGVTAGTYHSVIVDSKGRITYGSNPTKISEYGITDALSTTLIEGRILIGNSSNLATSVTMSGDGTLATNGAFTLSNSGVGAGTYHSVTVDIKGRVTSGSNPTTLTGYGISDAMNTSHPANVITSLNITNWNSAFGWGDHAGKYRPITYVPAWSEITSNPFSFASLANGQILIYNSVSGKWENSTPTYLSSETDPVFNVSAAKGISATNITNWNSAFGWGDHAGKYRPMTYVPTWSEITSNPFSFASLANGQILIYNSVSGKWENSTPTYLSSETDPVFNVSAAKGISATNITNWNSAFGWGDHAGKYRPITYVPDWTDITNKPTTFSGYGVTNGILTTVQINDVIKLSPSLTQKLNTEGSDGDIYIYDDGSAKHILCKLNGIWKQLDN